MSGKLISEIRIDAKHDLVYTLQPTDVVLGKGFMGERRAHAVAAFPPRVPCPLTQPRETRQNEGHEVETGGR